MWTTLAIFRKTPKVNNQPMAETSPNLVTLLSISIVRLSIFFP
jgi:hypothetical protein